MRKSVRSRSAPSTTVLATSLLVVLSAHPASALPGQLDTGFGGDGRVTTDFTRGDDVAFDVAIQADGKVIAAGTANYRGANARFALARYDTNGALDATFGGDGKVTTNFTSAWDGAFSVAIQPADGKIVVAGEAGGTGPAESAAARFALARYDTAGVLDPTFGGDGKVTTNVSRGADFVFGLAIQADGKIVVTGRVGGSGGRIALARYNADGSLDATFGGDGKVATNVTVADDRADDLAIQADGRIVVAGTANYFSNGARFALVRYEADGSRDATFSGDGIVTTHLATTFDGAFGVTVQPGDGKIVAVGQAGGGDAGRFGLARFNTNGSLDGTFGGDGKVITDFSTRLDYAEDIAIQADGKIVAGGAIRFFGPDSRFALARYELNGTLDDTFGGDGRVTTDFSAGRGGIFGVEIQPADGKTVAVGPAGFFGGRFGLARYLP
jgi:uncharacterized delta-60 repeat protein